MNIAAEPDIGPLTWVKGEIDLALERTVEALDRHAAEGGDPAHLKAARAHLHQAHGALAIVGLDGVTRFSEALEQLLEAIENGRAACVPAADTARRGIAAIRRYLDELIAGRPNQPLRLLPDYRTVMAALGHENASPADLFFPDLSLRPPRRDREPPTLGAAEYETRIKAARMGFQRGLLKWLKDDPRGVKEMRGSLAIVEATQSQPAARAFWWAAMAFLDAVAANAVPVHVGTRRLCARIDIQMKKLLAGSRTVAERLMRDTLHHVASAGPAGDHLECVRAAYRLADLLPTPETATDIEPLRPLLVACRERLAQAMDDWNRFCAGTAAALPGFHEHVRDLAARVAELRHADLAHLAKLILATADGLRKAPLAHTETLGLEMATALLLADNALDGFQRLGPEFAGQVATVGSRLAAALGNRPLAALEIPQLDEMSRRAQEKLLLAQVAKEILVNLGVIEQSLDAYFRDPGKSAELASVAKPIKQVDGALTVLGQQRAVEVLRECAAAIEGFDAAGESQPSRHADFEEVARKLSALGFFVEKLQHGPADIDSFLRPAAPPAAEEAAPTAEVEIEEAKRLTQTLVGALRAQPEDAELRGEIRQSLEVVRENAELVDDAQLAEQASAAIEAIELEQPSVAIEAAVAQIAPPEAPAAAPSPETARLAEASSEELDAELLGIFIEEAHEVLATIAGQLPQLASQPHDVEALTTVRRGFHTLKGSGRMVGLAELGEAAWAVEQVLNRWLKIEQEASPPLLDMIDQAHRLFVDWVAQLEAGGGLGRNATELAATCERLKGEPPAPPAVAAEPPPAEPEAEAPAEEAETPPEPKTEIEAEPAPAPEAGRAPALRLVPPSAPEPPDVRVGELVLAPTLYELYVAEARDHLATLQRELAVAGPPRPTQKRAAHTLAGISATTGIEPVHRLAHALEMALNRLDAAGATPTEAQHLLTARAVGALEGMLGAVAERRMPQLEGALATELDSLTVAPPAETAPAPATATEAAIEAPPPAIEAAPEASIPTPTPEPEPGFMPATYPQQEDFDRREMRLADELDTQLLPIFLEESVDLTRDIGASLRQWRDHADVSTADRLKRLLHTFKGSARMAGAMGIGQLVHGMESRIEQAVAANAATPAFLDGLDASFDRVQMLLDQLHGRPAPQAEAMEQAAAEAAPDQALPAIAAPAAPAMPPAPRVPAAHAEPPAEPAGEAEAEVAARAMLRVRAGVVDKLVNEAGEIAIARGRIEGEMRALKTSLVELTENVIRLRNQLREIEIHAESQMQSRQAMAAEQNLQFDPLEFDRFTRFQELTRMMAESVNDVATSQQALLQNLDHADAALTAQARLNREHSEALMNVRMVPFNTLADRLYRIVRQTAKELGKRANLDIRGGQTELDRSVLEKMTGPLEHLLRNAVAHGLETPGRRLAAGKPEIGEIALRVAQEGNEIAIELADDGTGLDLERIRARGVETGLLAADAAATPEQLTALIFRSGLSTAERLTSVAGRGIGMDVVRNETANLGGRIGVDSVPGRGTRFRIYLPLTLAVINAVIVRVGSRRYAIPAAMVAQVNELKVEAIEAIRADGGTVWLGERYAWHYLPRLLGDAGAQPEPARRHWLMLLRAGDQRAAIEVDGLFGNQEVVTKNIGPQLARVIGVSGATVLGDGEIVLILNPVALVGRQRQAAAEPTAGRVETTEETAAAIPATPAAAVATAATVMVVDDSLTVRKITGRLLAREGYHVLTAKDGVDALEQLLDTVPDVMLVDIEMPRMDGFDLTRNVRMDERLKHVPVIMITSRIADKHRNYAKQIGVDHYLGKPYDEDQLLKLIAGYTEKNS